MAIDTSWAGLDAGNDWAAQVIRSIFPINGSPDFQIGAAQTVIGGMLMQFTGWVMVLAGVFVSYALIVEIQRAVAIHAGL